MQYSFRFLLFAFGMLASPALLVAAEGNVWSYEDSDGVTHFSNVPDNSRYRLYLKTPGSYRLKPEFNPGGAVKTSSRSGALTIGQDKLPYAAMVAAAATEQQLDPALLHAIIHVESRHNPEAVSPKGAIGLMQVLPETARRMGVDSISTPAANINAGARYMRFLLDIFGKDVQLALAAYNAGENAVIRHGNQIPPYPETLAYVPAVITAYQQLRKQKP
jgi:soluble lytic murein transglycosylase-like protein